MLTTRLENLLPAETVAAMVAEAATLSADQWPAIAAEAATVVVGKGHTTTLTNVFAEKGGMGEEDTIVDVMIAEVGAEAAMCSHRIVIPPAMYKETTAAQRANLVRPAMR